MVQKNRQQIKQIFYDFKNINADNENDSIHENLIRKLHEFYEKYTPQKRKIKLTDTEKYQMIKDQNNLCAISGSPVFIGDEVEVDHRKPLSIGGEDSMKNLQIAHKHSNRSKGSKYEDESNLE